MRKSAVCITALCVALLALGTVTASAGDLYVPTGYATIQAAVDAAAASGDVIHVAAGTYREQVKIELKSLDLVGAGIGSTIVEAVDLGDRTTYSITQWSGSAKTIDACIGIVGPCTVNISELTLDGRELGPDGFYGIHYFDASGSVTDCRIEDVLNASAPGAQNVVSIVATHSATGACVVEYSDNVIPNFQKVGIAVLGPDSDCTIERNDIDNAPSDYNAGNGIQVSYGASGTVTDNTVTGVAYTGEDWGATGILCFESGDVAVSGGSVDQCQMGLNFSQWNWIYDPASDAVISFDGVSFDQCDWSIGVHLGDPGAGIDLTVENCAITGGTYSGVDLWGSDVDPWGGGYYSGWTSGAMTAVVNNNTFECGDGIVEWIDVSGGTVDITASGNTFSGCGDYGVYNNYTNTVDAEGNWWGDAAGPTLVLARGSSGSKRAPSPYLVSDDAIPSGWNAPAGPDGAPTDAGVNVSTGVDYDPWLLGNIVCDPDPEYLTVADPVKTVAVKYLGGGSGLLYGYSIKFTWDGAIAGTAFGSVTEGDLLTNQGTTFFFAAPTGGNEITVDSALLGDEPGVTGPGTLFTIEFTGVAVGTSDIDITILEARDADNNALTGFVDDDGLLIVDVSAPTIADVLIWNDTLGHTDDYIKNTDTARVTATVLDDDPTFGIGNITADLQGLGGGATDPPTTYNAVTGAAVWTITITSVTCLPLNGTVTVTVSAADPIGNPAAPGSDTIIADNLAPTVVLDFDAAPGHEKCDLTWTLGTDLYLDGTVIQRNDNAGEYPTYPLFVGAWPAVVPFYPADHTLGTNVFTGAGTTTADVVVPRNIYYYQAFCYDIARNYGIAATTARDLATNYWLGDVTTTLGLWDGYNGYVNDADIDKLGGTYQVAAPGAPNDQCDVGPTVHPDDHRFGLPLPDAYVQFEDLMIFAMNYGRVSPRVVPFLPEESSKALSLELAEIGVTDDGVLEMALRLVGNATEVKGASVLLSYDTSELEYVSSRLSGDMVSPLAPVFFWHESDGETVLIDLAVLGTDVTIGGSGDIAILTFRTQADEYAVGFESADLRGAANEALSVSLSGFESRPEYPTAFRLVQNSPNPFNPKTSIAFTTPRECHVAIRVYDVTGRLVRTLVDESIEAGRHEILWNGRNDRNEPVGSGVYFCTMEADQYAGSTKMLLMK